MALTTEQLLLLSGGIQGLGGILGSRESNRQSNQDRFLSERARQESREDQARTLLAAFLSGRSAEDDTDRRGRALLGLESTQLDPYAQATSKNRANLLRQIGQGSTPFKIGGNLRGSGGVNIPAGGFDMSALSPAALTEAERLFFTQVAGANPFAPTGGGESVEAFRQGELAKRKDRRKISREEIMAFLSQVGDPTTRQIDIGPLEKEKKKGGGFGGFLKGLANIAGFAMPFIPGVGPLAGATGALGGLFGLGRGNKPTSYETSEGLRI